MASRSSSLEPCREPPPGWSWGYPVETDEEDDQRVPPGRELRPQDQEDAFTRLHSRHAEKLAKFAMKRQEGLRLEEARISEMQRQTVRCATEADIASTSARLYGDARLRQKRHEELRRRNEELESSALGASPQELRPRGAVRSSSTGAIPKPNESEPAWERLHALASKKDRRTELARKQNIRDVEEWLKAHSLHTAPEVSSSSVSMACDRLYRDSHQRELRLMQMRSDTVAAEAHRVAEASVHRLQETSGLPAHDAAAIDERFKRLYEDGQQRQARKEEKEKALQSKQTDLQAVGRTAHPPSGLSRFDMLYYDAGRRDHDRRLLKEQAEQEELLNIQSESIHAFAQEAPYREEDLRGAFDRISQTKTQQKRHGVVSNTIRNNTPRNTPRTAADAYAEHGSGAAWAASTARAGTPPPVISRAGLGAEGAEGFTARRPARSKTPPQEIRALTPPPSRAVAAARTSTAAASRQAVRGSGDANDGRGDGRSVVAAPRSVTPRRQPAKPSSRVPWASRTAA